MKRGLFNHALGILLGVSVLANLTVSRSASQEPPVSEPQPARFPTNTIVIRYDIEPAALSEVRNSAELIAALRDNLMVEAATPLDSDLTVHLSGRFGQSSDGGYEFGSGIYMQIEPNQPVSGLVSSFPIQTFRDWDEDEAWQYFQEETESGLVNSLAATGGFKRDDRGRVPLTVAGVRTGYGTSEAQDAVGDGMVLKLWPERGYRTEARLRNTPPEGYTEDVQVVLIELTPAPAIAVGAGASDPSTVDVPVAEQTAADAPDTEVSLADTVAVPADVEPWSPLAFNPALGKPAAEWAFGGAGVSRGALDSRGRYAAIALSSEPKIVLLDLDGRSQVGEIDVNRDSGGKHVSSLAFGPSGNRLAIGLPMGRVRIVDTRTRETLQELQYSKDGTSYTPVASLKFDPAGGRVLGFTGNAVVVWDPDSGELLSTWEAGSVKDLAVTPEGTRVAMLISMESMKIWDSQTASEICALPGDFSGLTMHPAGDRIAAWSFEEKVVVASTSDCSEIAAWPAAPSFVPAIAWAADGKHLILGSADGPLHVYTEQGELAGVWSGHATTSRVLTSSGSNRVLSFGLGKESEAILWEREGGAAASEPSEETVPSDGTDPSEETESPEETTAAGSITVSPDVLDRLAGEYGEGGRSMVIRSDGRNLLLSSPDDSESKEWTLHPLSEKEFWTEHDGTRIQLSFSRDDEGRAFAVTIKQMGFEMTLPRLR